MQTTSGFLKLKVDSSRCRAYTSQPQAERQELTRETCCTAPMQRSETLWAEQYQRPHAHHYWACPPSFRAEAVTISADSCAFTMKDLSPCCARRSLASEPVQTLTGSMVTAFAVMQSVTLSPIAQDQSSWG